mgnify:CR=1 FL=1
MYNILVKKLRFCFNLSHSENTMCHFCERNALFVAFILNFVIFGVELYYGLRESSAALLSDSGHNIGDAIILGSSLFFINASIKDKAKLALVKCMFWVFFGFLALFHVYVNLSTGLLPSHLLVGSIGVGALIVNISTVIFMYGFKEDDINIKSAYICCRNDAIGNILIILSAYLVYLLNTNWPDIIAGLIIATLMFISAYRIAKESFYLIKRGQQKVTFVKKRSS